MKKYLFVIFALVLLCSSVVSGVPGAIWTRIGSCEPGQQDANHYKVGWLVYLGGENFDPGTYDWDITGNPGGSSGDPDITVASGQVTVGDDGTFCIYAYTIQADDWGEYKYTVGSKHDNYRVDEDVQYLKIIKCVQGNNPSLLKITFDITKPDNSHMSLEVKVHAGDNKCASDSVKVPAGDYTVTEPTIPGFDHVGDATQTVTVPVGGTGEAQFTNKLTPKQYLKVIKCIQGNNPSLLKITFDITKPDNSHMSLEVKVHAGDNKCASDSIEVPAGAYTVTEPAVYGFDHVGEATQIVTVPVGGTGVAQFTNKLTPKQYLKVIKCVQGNNPSALKITFDITKPNNSHTSLDVTVPAGNNKCASDSIEVPVGAYIVTEPTIPDYEHVGDATLTITVPEGGTGVAEFTNIYKPPDLGCIGDFVWLDNNANTNQDDGPQSGIANVIIKLFQNGKLIATTKTDKNGKYLFQDLLEGTYVVDIDQNCAALKKWNLHFSTNNDPLTVKLEEGQCFLDADFGYYYLGCAEGFVYANGKPVFGATVRLDSKDIKSTKHKTDKTGHYFFDDVLIGIEYTLSVEGQPGLEITFTLTDADHGCFTYNFNGGECKPVLAWYSGWYSGPNSNDPMRFWLPTNQGGVNDEPLFGFYDSYDQNMWEYHILLAWASDIDGFVVDWYGKDSYEQTPTKGLLDAAQSLWEKYHHLGFDFKIIVAYNQGSTGGLDENLQFLANNIIIHPAYWGTRDGTTRPVFVYCENDLLNHIEFSKKVDELMPSDVAVLWNWSPEHSDMIGYVDGFYPWVQATNGNWDPNGKEWGEKYLENFYSSVGSLNTPFFVGATWPGFDDRNWVMGNGHFMDRQDTKVFDWTWGEAFEYQPKWLLIETWNTFNQSTHVEITDEFGDKFIKLVHNYSMLWKGSCARHIPEIGLSIPELIYIAHMNNLDDTLINQALIQFFQGNYSQALAILNIQVQPAPASIPRNDKLVLVQGSQAANGEGWDNAVDGDLLGWDGTTTAKGFPKGGTYAIFEFKDQGLYMFNTIRLQTDNGTDDDAVTNRHANDVEVLVSTTGTNTADFKSVKRFAPNSDDMIYITLPNYCTAKYIKLVLWGPLNSKGNWRQIVEFGVSVDKSNHATPLSAESTIALVPTEFSLSQNYPNPFNPLTTILYTLPAESNVTLKIYDLMGREIETLVSQTQQVGQYSVEWNAATYPSGVYYYRLQAGSNVNTKQMILLK